MRTEGIGVPRPAEALDCGQKRCLPIPVLWLPSCVTMGGP